MKIKSIVPLIIYDKKIRGEETTVFSYLCSTDEGKLFTLNLLKTGLDEIDKAIIHSAEIYQDNVSFMSKSYSSVLVKHLDAYTTRFTSIKNDDGSLSLVCLHRLENDRVEEIHMEISSNQLYAALFMKSYYFLGIGTILEYEDDAEVDPRYLACCLFQLEDSEPIKCEFADKIVLENLASPNTNLSKFDRLRAKLGIDVLTDELFAVTKINDFKLAMKVDSNDGKVYSEDKFRGYNFDTLIKDYENDPNLYFSCDMIDLRVINYTDTGLIILCQNYKGEFKIIIVEKSLIVEKLGEDIDRF